MDVACPQCRRSVPGERPLCTWCGARLQPPVPCKTCGHTLSAHLKICPYCNAPTTHAAPLPGAPTAPAAPTPAPANLQTLGVDVNARVMWGEDRQAIRSDLLKKGIPARDVDRALDRSVRERNAHFRSAGIDDLLMVGGCVVGWIVTLVLFLLVSKRSPNFALVVTLWTFLCVLPVAAIYFAVRGGRRIVLGGKAEGSATDMDDDLFSD